jgi:hypothetical protein
MEALPRFQVQACLPDEIIECAVLHLPDGEGELGLRFSDRFFAAAGSKGEDAPVRVQ